MELIYINITSHNNEGLYLSWKCLKGNNSSVLSTSMN